MTWAFRAYATGNWTAAQIYEELIARALTTVPAPRNPAKPLACSLVHRMLTNPYYKGDVTYKGVTYAGAAQADRPDRGLVSRPDRPLGAQQRLGPASPPRPLPQGRRLLRRLRLTADDLQRAERQREHLSLFRVRRPALQAHQLHPPRDPRGQGGASRRRPLQDDPDTPGRTPPRYGSCATEPTAQAHHPLPACRHVGERTAVVGEGFRGNNDNPGSTRPSYAAAGNCPPRQPRRSAT